MSTEDRIHTFAQIFRRVGARYVQLARQQSSAHDTFSKQELLAVDMLGGGGSCRMGEMAEHLGVVQSAITPLVDRLEDQGMVQRVRSREDRRVCLVELTDKGQVLYADQEKLYRAIAAEMLAPLDTDEQDTLIQLMSRMVADTAPA